MEIFAASASWNPPGGVFDYELLAQPGTMSNVNNGFGFVGAGVEASITWVPDKATQELLGYDP